MKGTIKWFNLEKRYGFIAADTGEDIFIHVFGFAGKPLPEGTRVEFETETGSKGLRAVNVREEGKEKPRLFPFSTHKMIKSVFRGSLSEAEMLAEHSRSKHQGLFGNEEGTEPIDRFGFGGHMAEWRLREMVKQKHLFNSVRFHIRMGERTLPGSNRPTPIIEDMNAAQLIRMLDGLSDDQCPVCREKLPPAKGGFAAEHYCPCGYSEAKRW